MGTVTDIHDVKFGFVSGLLFVDRADLAGEGVDGIILYDADGAAAKATAGNTGTQNARNLPCQRG